MGRKRLYESDADKMRAYRDRQAATIKARQTETITAGIAPPPAIESIPATKRWKMLLEQARETVETVQREMTDYAEARSDRWQDSEKADEFQARLEGIENLISSFDELDG